MIYPCLLVTVSVIVITVLLMLVIPRFAELFATLDVPMPPTTALLIGLSETLRSYWWAVGGISAAVCVAAYLWLKTNAGKRAVDTLVLRLPQIGRIVKSFATARIARLLGVLMDSQLPVLEALRLTRGALANVHYADLIARTEQAVEKGQPISSSFSDTDLISPSVYEATRSGEKSGQIAPLLLNLADFLDEENEIVVRSLVNILEPAVLIVMGVLVAFVALSMFTPLFDVTAMAGGGG
jgi:type II secretory pathway component PulF